MNVLSLFDGISCGQLALQKAGVKYDNYFASEIDKHAIKVTQHHFPNTIQLGDVTKINHTSLPKIDLLIGGSPCQSFSIAGNGLGFSGKSGLYFEFLRLFNDIRPKYFLFENVKMRDDWRDVISADLKIRPHLIDSKDFSPQSRKRYYWTNIQICKTVPKSMRVRDIWDKNEQGYIFGNGVIKQNNHKTDFICIGIKPESTKTKGNYFPRERIFHIDGIARTLTSSFSQYPFYSDSIIYRKFTPEECESLQTVHNGYTNIVTKNQRYKMLGNCWTVDVVAHIFKGLV